MVPSTYLLLIAVSLSCVASQTFQYSRGWTNGKRDAEGLRDVTRGLERVLSPCQMKKLKYLLEGKPMNERVAAPCEYYEDDLDNQSKRYKAERSQDPLFDAFQ